MEKNKYRIVTDGDVFRIELHWSYTKRPFFFGTPVLIEGWTPCDNVGQFAVDDEYGDLLPEEIVEYSTLEKAKAKIKEWTTPIILPKWEVVWP